jgi:hypothetical protein
MKLARFKTIFFALAILAGVLLVGSLVASSLLLRGSVYAQLAERLEAAELFGESQNNVYIGSPQKFLAFPPEAYLQGIGEQGAQLINNAYLKQNGIYPFQVKTVEFIRNIIAICSLLGGMLMLLLWATANRLSQRNSQMA